MKRPSALYTLALATLRHLDIERDRTDGAIPMHYGTYANNNVYIEAPPEGGLTMSDVSPIDYSVPTPRSKPHRYQAPRCDHH